MKRAKATEKQVSYLVTLGLDQATAQNLCFEDAKAQIRRRIELRERERTSLEFFLEKQVDDYFEQDYQRWFSKEEH